MGGKQLILTFDDACKSHLEFVLPVLQQYGFGATFFVCRPDKWLQKDPEAYLSGEEILQIYRAGFEIGNHTMNHAGMAALSDEECRFELKTLNDWLAQYGIPAPVSFAYPGGPYCANAAQLLPEFGIRAARTTELGLWDKAKTDPMRVPCFAVSENDENNFYAAVELANEDENCAVTILYHGVPDLAHPWCNTPEDMFAKHMKYLADNDFCVISMKDFSGR
ncbi:MAG: polysaccharide deacetylase family protein [Lentisphaerae bacterium]|nr:polysaccharide deacetylase family protein [Lentisphaerota bacterium]